MSSNDNEYDLVFSIRVTNNTGSIGYVKSMIREMIRVAKHNGYVLFDFLNNKRPFRDKTKHIHFTFARAAAISHEALCSIVKKSGILVFSLPLLEKIPPIFLSIWYRIERLGARLFRPWASRGFILLEKA